MALEYIIKSVVVVCCLCFATGLVAQEQKKTPAEIAKFQTNWMKGNLELTADQYPKVYTIMLERAQGEDMAPVKEPARAEWRKNADARRDNELKTVLTEAQFNKFHRQDK